MEQPVTPAPETPATIPITSAELSFAEQRKATKEGKTEIATAPVAKVETQVEAPPESPEKEADSHKPDAELSEAAKTLRKSRQTERTKRLSSENDELARELQRRRELRSELERFAPAPPRTADGRTSAGTAPEQSGEVDPADPEPHEAAFQDYGQFLTEKAKWAARNEFKKQQDATRARTTRETYERVATEQAKQLDAMQDKGRERYADFDAVVDKVLSALKDNPRAGVVSKFFAKSKAGEALVYRIGSQADVLQAVTSAPDADDLFRVLLEHEHEILAPTKAPKPLTAAPAPPTHTVGSGGGSVTETDENKLDFGTLHRKRKAERLAARG